jgi:peptide/nickel transport system substrate-binding protein
MKSKVPPSQVRRTIVAGGFTVLCLAVLWMAFDVTRSQAITPQVPDLPIRIGTTELPTSLDPADAYDFHSWEILQNIASGLLMPVPGTTELAPGLAKAMPEVSPDGLVYTVTLRSALWFPDGTPFDAYAVKWSIDRVAALAGGPSWFVTEFVSEVQVVDSTTVRFVLNEPYYLFPTLLASPTYFPVSPNCFPAGDFDPTSDCGGIGPYRLTIWGHGATLELDAYAGYYGPAPKSASVIVQYHYDVGDLRAELELGNMDIAWKTLTPEDYEELRADPAFNVVEGGSSYIRYICYNTITPPFDGAGVRAALGAAVDRETTAQQVYLNTLSPLYSMVPSGMWSHRDAFLDLYGQRNLTETRTLLQQAGYSETNKLMMDLWYAEEHYGPMEPDLAAALAADIEESGMVSVTVRHTDWATYRNRISAGSMPVFLLGWYPDFLDPDNYTWTFAHSSSSGGLGIFYDNPTMDSLLEAGRVATPIQGAAREAIYVDIQELWAEEAPTIPLLQGALIAVGQERIRDIVISPGGTLLYSTIWRDTSVSETIDPSGGSLTSYDGHTVLEFPAGALTSTVVMTLTPVSTAPLGRDLASIGRSYELSAVYLDTGEPARLAPGYTYSVTAHYSAADVAAVDESRLALFSWNGSQWAREPSSQVHLGNMTVTTTPDHFSLWAVLAETHLRVATDAHFPPMEYISGTQIVGHDIDLMDALAVEMSTTVTYTDVPWDELFPGLGAGEYEAVISTVSVTPEREEEVDFTLPYVTFGSGGAGDSVGIALRQGNSAFRRQMNEALCELRSDGTLAAIIAAIAADEPTWNPRLPDWHYAEPGTKSTLIYTDTGGTSTSIQVPSDAVAETVLLAYTPVDTTAPPSGFAFANRAFDVDVYRDGSYLSSGYALSIPATITIQYIDTDVFGLDEGTLVLVRWNKATSSWEDAACGAYGRHPDENWLAVPVCHLSRFALLGKYTSYLPLVLR